jgi:tyrosine-protein kinase Etk/Wzc
MTDTSPNAMATSPVAHFENVTSVDVVDILTYLYAHKWKILIIAAVVFAITAFHAFTQPRIYQAKALLEVGRKQLAEGSGGVNVMANILGTGGGSSNTGIIVLRSNLIIGTAVDELGLANSVQPEYLPFLGARIARQYEGEGLAEPLFGLGSYAWGGEKLGLDRLDISGELGEEVTEWRLEVGEEQAFSLYSASGDKVLDGRVEEPATAEYEKSRLDIYISEMVARPGQSFTIVHTPRIGIIEQLQDSVQVNEMGTGTGIVGLYLQGTNKYQIVNILKEISNVYVRNSVEQNSENAQRSLEFIDEQLPGLKEKLDIAAAELEQYRQEIGSANMTLETQIAVKKLSEYDEKLSELQLKHEELSQKFTEKHPTLQSVTRQIEKIRNERMELERELHELPEKEVDFIEKERKVTVAKSLYEELLNKGQQLRLTKAGTVGNVRIIDQAHLSFRPVNAGKSMQLLLGLVLGLLLGAGWVLLKRMLHKGVDDPVLIENMTGQSVIATIPHSEEESDIFSLVSSRKKRASGLKLLAYEKEGDLAIEALRSFRTSMRFSMKTAANNVMIISGPAPSIGKSFFSANYAAISAIEGQRVLLVDADMRRGHLHQYMGTNKIPGLAELIMDECTPQQAVHEVAENLYFIAGGEKTARPAELLASDNFQNLLLQLQQDYDLVIIDTPPILAVTDASIIAQYGGQLFVLLRSGQHKMSEIQASISRFEKNGVKISGLLMNDADMSKDTSGHVYHYEYK